MVDKKDVLCKHCGAKMLEHRHSLNKTLVKCLHRLHKAGGRAMIRKLQLETKDFNNFQKLKYWGLAEKIEESYEWLLTTKGDQFLHGHIALPKRVTTYRNEVINEDKTTIFVTDAISDHIDWWRKNYATNATVRS